MHGCIPCLGRRGSTQVTTAYSGSATTVDMGELMAIPGAFLVFQHIGVGRYSYLTLEDRCIWQTSSEPPCDLLARMRCGLDEEERRVVVADPLLAGYAHGLSELAASHRDYVKTSTKGADIQLACTLAAADLIALTRLLQAERLAAQLPLERRFVCFDTPHPQWRLREVGAFVCRDRLRYVALTRSAECNGSRAVCNRGGEESLLYDAREDAWSRGRGEDAVAFVRTGKHGQQQEHLVPLAMPVVLYSDISARFLDGGVLRSEKRERLRRLSALNRAYAPAVEIRVGMPGSLFKHAYRVALCDDGLTPIWRSEREVVGEDPESVAAWLVGSID